MVQHLQGIVPNQKRPTRCGSDREYSSRTWMNEDRRNSIISSLHKASLSVDHIQESTDDAVGVDPDPAREFGEYFSGLASTWRPVSEWQYFAVVPRTLSDGGLVVLTTDVDDARRGLVT